MELKQIQDSLISHVNLDPAAAIGVLCDHCSLDPDFTAEEKEDREKLRKLVLFFLATTAKKDIYGHFGGPNSEVEQVFRDGLVKVGTSRCENMDAFPGKRCDLLFLGNRWNRCSRNRTYRKGSSPSSQIILAAFRAWRRVAAQLT